MKQFLIIVFFASSSLFGQVNCPLNTPEFPFTTDDDWNLYSWSANLYHPNQMSGAQTINSISFRLDNVGAFGSYTYSSCRIWVRHTAVSNYASSTGYPGTAGFTEVYSGSFTFSGTGVFTFNFNVTPSFAYNGTSFFEVLFENRGGSDNTWEEPWFDRTDGTAAGIFPGKVGWGNSWSNAKTISSNRRFNLQINNVTCGVYPLPVTLTSSELICNDDFVTLEWITEAEINNNYFTVESSNDGRNWVKEIDVEGRGNSNTLNNYSVNIKKNKSIRTNYYRLSQTDFDGKHEKLVTHSSDCNEMGNIGVSIYPNPFTDKIKVFGKKNNTISIYNILGEKQDLPFSTKDNVVEYDAASLVNGVYFVVVGDKSYKLVK